MLSPAETAQAIMDDSTPAPSPADIKRLAQVFLDLNRLDELYCTNCPVRIELTREPGRRAAAEPSIWVEHEDGHWETYAGPFADEATARAALEKYPIAVRELYRTWAIR